MSGVTPATVKSIRAAVHPSVRWSTVAIAAVILFIDSGSSALSHGRILQCTLHILRGIIFHKYFDQQWDLCNIFELLVWHHPLSYGIFTLIYSTTFTWLRRLCWPRTELTHGQEKVFCSIMTCIRYTVNRGMDKMGRKRQGERCWSGKHYNYITLNIPGHECQLGFCQLSLQSQEKWKMP